MTFSGQNHFGLNLSSATTGCATVLVSYGQQSVAKSSASGCGSDSSLLCGSLSHSGTSVYTGHAPTEMAGEREPSETSQHIQTTAHVTFTNIPPAKMSYLHGHAQHQWGREIHPTHGRNGTKDLLNKYLNYDDDFGPLLTHL